MHSPASIPCNDKNACIRDHPIIRQPKFNTYIDRARNKILK